jgi:hypothetical protein
LPAHDTPSPPSHRDATGVRALGVGALVPGNAWNRAPQTAQIPAASGPLWCTDYELSQGKQKTGCHLLARQVRCLWVPPFQGGQGLVEGQDPQCSCPGNRLRPAADTEFAIDIAGVGLDRVRREEKPGREFLIGQPLGEELQYF